MATLGAAQETGEKPTVGLVGLADECCEHGRYPLQAPEIQGGGDGALVDRKGAGHSTGTLAQPAGILES
jgi:hypothetical protein